MLTRRDFTKLALASGVVLASGVPAFAKQKPIWFRSAPVAANGYDVVAYFTQSKPVAGTNAHTHEWQGATWRFSSAENKALFAANPARYAPQYGGHCAFAMAKGYLASTVPEAWSIENGKLYLNYSLSVRKTWEADKANFIPAGDKNWPKQ